MYDPLDRDIPTKELMEDYGVEGDPWTTKRDDLMKKVIELVGIPGTYLDQPMSNSLHH